MPQDPHGLVHELVEKGVLTSPHLKAALEAVDRADFVPDDLRHLAYDDEALPIGAGQTISQPYTVAFMLEQLDVEPGQSVLEIGYGSGWQTALLAHLVGERGVVYALELVPVLCKEGARNLRRYPELEDRVHLLCADAERGCEDGAPFDRIIAAAEVKHIPQQWRDQLRTGGVMLYPHGEGIVREVKRENGFESQRFPGFIFVPFM